MTYNEKDFDYWESEGKVAEKEFIDIMNKRNKSVEYYNHIDKRVDFRSKIYPNVYYEPKQVGKFPPEWLISHLGMKFPIVLDYGKIVHYENFTNEDANRKLYVVIKLHYYPEVYASTRNGWYYIDARDLVAICKRTPHRKYERQLRDDEKKT